MPKRAALLIPGLVVAVATVAVQAGSGQAKPPTASRGAAAHMSASADPALDPVAGYLMREFGIERAEAERRVDLQTRVGELQDYLGSRYGRDYGGLWIDQQAASLRIRVGTAAGTNVDVEGAADQFGLGGVVDRVEVRYNLSQLEAFKEELRRQLLLAGVTAATIRGIDIRLNRIDIEARDVNNTRLQTVLSAWLRDHPSSAQAAAPLGTYRLLSAVG